jgi:hypothetical protein
MEPRASGARRPGPGPRAVASLVLAGALGASVAMSAPATEPLRVDDATAGTQSTPEAPASTTPPAEEVPAPAPGSATPTAPSSSPVVPPAATPSTTPATPPSTSTTPTAPGGGSTSSPADSAAARRERTRIDAEETLRKALLPQPMPQARFVALLGATDAALAADATLLEAHANYLASVEKLNENSIRQLLRLLPAAYSWDAGTEAFVPRSTPELIALLGLRDKAVRNAVTAERRLLQAVENAVPADKRHRYDRALLAWRHELLPRAALLPSTRVTIVELAALARLGPDSVAAIEQILGEYAGALATALAERAQLLRDHDSARAIIETAAGTLWRYAPDEIAAATAAELDELDARDFASEIAIRTLHFDALARIRARIQPRDGRRLVELWQRTVHPELFDDERLLSRIVEDTLAHPSFSADHDTALLDALETSYQRLEPLSRAACEAADLVLPRLPNRSQASMAAEIDARIATLDAQEKRRAVVKDALQRVRAMLGDADPALSARVDDAIFSADSLARADAFERRALSARREALADGPATPVAAPGGAAPGKETTPAPAPSGTTTNAPGGRTAPSTPADGTATPPATDDTQTPRGGRGGRRARPS